jgi:hypothetical protein
LFRAVRDQTLSTGPANFGIQGKKRPTIRAFLCKSTIRQDIPALFLFCLRSVPFFCLGYGWLDQVIFIAHPISFHDNPT